MFKPSSVMIRSAAVALAAGALIAGCGGSNGFSGGSSSNNISTISLSFPVKPSLTAPGVYALSVRAYDRTGTQITVPYSYPIILQSNNQCQVGFKFYTTAASLRQFAAVAHHDVVRPEAVPSAAPAVTPTPNPVSISWNNPKQTVAVVFDPTLLCNPTPPPTTTLTASAIGATSATINI